MSPQCSTKRSVALGSLPAFSVISLITEISETEERKSSALKQFERTSWDCKELCYGCPISCHSQAMGTGRHAPVVPPEDDNVFLASRAFVDQSCYFCVACRAFKVLCCWLNEE